MMLKFTFKAFCGLCWLTILSASLAAQTPIVLTPEKPVVRELAGKQSDNFSVALKKGELLRISAVQQGIDVVLSLYSPDNKLLIQRDAPNSTAGAEEVSTIVPADGSYRLEVSSFDEKAPAGKYTVRMETPRLPDDKDLLRVKAEQIFSDAMPLRLKPDKESQQAAQAKFIETVPLWEKLGDKYWRALSLQMAGGIASANAAKKEDAAQGRQLLTGAINLSREISDAHLEQSSIASLADSFYKFEEYEKAIAEYEKSIALAHSLNEPAAEGAGQYFIGNAYFNLGKYEPAAAAFEKSLAIYRSLKDLRSVGIILNRLGDTYGNLKNDTQALSFYEQATEAARAEQNKEAEAEALYNIAVEHQTLKNFPKALETFQKTLALQRGLGDKDRISETLKAIVTLYKLQKDEPKVLAAYDELLSFYRQNGDRRAEANALNDLGIYEGSLKNYQQNIKFQQQSLAIFRELNDSAAVAVILNNLANSFSSAGDNEQAIDFYNQAIERQKANHELAAAAASLGMLEGVYEKISQPEKAVATYEAQAAIYHELKDARGEATAYNRIGVMYSSKLNDLIRAKEYNDKALAVIRTTDDKAYETQIIYNGAVNLLLFSQYEKAIEVFTQVLEMRRAQKNRLGEADALERIGECYSRLEKTDDNAAKALESLQKALEIYRAEKNTPGEIGALNEIGDVYTDLKRFTEAAENFKMALELARQGDSKNLEVDVLHNLSLMYRAQPDIARALDTERQALAIYQTNGNKLGEAAALNEVGQIYNELGTYGQALVYFEKALTLARQTGEPDREATSLSRIASVYLSTGDYQKSIEYSEKSSSLFHSLSQRQKELTAIVNIGNAYMQLFQTDKALEYFQRGLTLNQEVSNLNSESIMLQGIAAVYYINEDYAKSFEYLQKALPLARALDQRETEAGLFSNLMKLFKYQNNPQAAIFYGKQSINLYQQIRGGIKDVDKELQKSYLKSNEDKYRTLADLLIQVGRLPEAQRILDMLKENEYSEFVQRGEGETKKLLGSVELTPAETEAVARYEKVSAEITTKGAEYEKLKKQRPATPEEQAELDKKKAALSADLTAASQTFNLVLKQIEAEFAKSKAATDMTATLRENNGLQSDLQRWKIPNTVILSTVVGDDNYSVILTTPNVQVVGRTAIKNTELNKLVHDFREAVQNPCACLDSRPLGEKLYNVLLKPIAPQLAELEKQANGKPLTLVWSLDGTLRYLPISALWDGKQYLTEKYLNVEFSLASRTRLGESPAADWRGLGVGVTQAHGDFAALPAVKDELLNGAIHDDQTATSKGIVPGRVFLDAQFTESSFARELSSGEYPLIHIASHFAFKPGNEKQSYLLMGDGGGLSLDKIRTSPDFKFTGVELLTLSACNTATGEAGADGKEFESFAVLAQQNGALAVMATLWSVADQSTQTLMSEFYRQHQENHLSKAESLRAAQLALLNGNLKTGADQARRSDLAGETTGNPANVPPFTKDAQKPFAHPFYWSPFVLIGNWK